MMVLQHLRFLSQSINYSEIWKNIEVLKEINLVVWRTEYYKTECRAKRFWMSTLYFQPLTVNKNEQNELETILWRTEIWQVFKAV